MLSCAFFSWWESQFGFCDSLFDEKISVEIKEDIVILEGETDIHWFEQSLYLSTVNSIGNIVKK